MALRVVHLETDLQGAWFLDSKFGSDIRSDYSINENDLVSGNADSDTGRVNNAARFNGTDQFLGAADHLSLQQLTTVSCFVYMDSIAADMAIVQKGSDATDNNSSIKLIYDQSEAGFAFIVGDGAGADTATTSGFTPAVRTWYHIIAWYDGTNVYIEVDGVERAKTAGTKTGLTETGEFYIGQLSGGSAFFDGLIDAVLVWDRVLTFSERIQLRNGGDAFQLPYLDATFGAGGRAGRSHRFLSPVFAEFSNGVLYIATGEGDVQSWDGFDEDFDTAGIDGPKTDTVLTTSGSGRITGSLYGVYRYVDGEGNVSNLSPISAKHEAQGGGAAITGMTNAAPIVVTSVAHGLSTGDRVKIHGQQGLTSANNRSFSVTVLTADTFSLDGSVGNGQWLGQDEYSVQVTSLQLGGAATNEIQTLKLVNSPTGGTIKLVVFGEKTSALNHNTSAATLQTALQALQSVNTVTCSGGPWPDTGISVTFATDHAATDVDPITESDNLLTGGLVAMSITDTTDGVAAASATVAFELLGAATGGTCAISQDGRRSAEIAYNATAAAVKTGLATIVGIDAADLTESGGPWPASVSMAFGASLANTDLDDFAFHLENLTGETIGVVTVARTVTGSSPTSEQIKVQQTAGSAVTGGNYTFIFTDVTGTNANSESATSKFIFNSSAASVAKQLEVAYDQFLVESGTANPLGISSGNLDEQIAATGGPLPTQVTLTFIGDLAGKAIAGALGSFAVHNGPFSSAIIPGLVGGEYEIIVLTAGGGTGANETQTVCIAGTPTEGTFLLTVVDKVIELDYNNTAAAAETEINAAGPGNGVGTVDVTGGALPGTCLTVEFTGTLGNKKRQLMPYDDTKLRSKITVSTSGATGTNEVKTITMSDGAFSGTWKITDGSANETAALSWQATAAQVQTAVEALATVGAGNVAAAGGPINEADITLTFQGTLAKTPIPAYTITSNAVEAASALSNTETTKGGGLKNTKHQLLISGDTVGGSFTLTYGSEVATIQHQDSASTIEDTLEDLNQFDTVITTGGALPKAVVIEYAGNKAGTAVALPTVDQSSLISSGWTSGANLVTYSSVDVPTDRRTVKREVYRTKDGDAGTFYLDIIDEELTATVLTSGNTDDEIGAAVASGSDGSGVTSSNTDGTIVIKDANGQDGSVAIHSPPPDWKRVIVSHKDRMFIAVNHNETNGKLKVTKGSKTVTGIDTQFNSSAVGRFLYSGASSNKSQYEIDSVDHATQSLGLATAYDGDTENHVDYAVNAGDAEALTVYFSEVGKPGSFDLRRGMTLNRVPTDGDFTGIMPLTNWIYFLFQDRMYRLVYTSDPTPIPAGDGQLSPAAWRGCLNQKCWVLADGTAFLMDRKGVYAYDDSAVHNVSEQIQPMFASDEQSPWQINFTNVEYFHCAYFAEIEVIKWFVCFGSDPYPRHALCCHKEHRRWWIEEYPCYVTSSAMGEYDGHHAVYLGLSGRRIALASRGALDIIANNNGGTLRGTATSAGQVSLTDTAATFDTTDVLGAPLQIVEGKGKGQSRIIIAATATVLTIKTEWTNQPDSTSVYQIGGIRWKWRTGYMRYSQTAENETRRFEVVWTPEDVASQMTMRRYEDFATTAVQHKIGRSANAGGGFRAVNGTGDTEIDTTKTEGLAQFQDDGFRAINVDGPRRLRVEMEGVPNEARHKIHEVNVSGADT